MAQFILFLATFVVFIVYNLITQPAKSDKRWAGIAESLSEIGIKAVRTNIGLEFEYRKRRFKMKTHYSSNHEPGDPIYLEIISHLSYSPTIVSGMSHSGFVRASIGSFSVPYKATDDTTFDEQYRVFGELHQIAVEYPKLRHYLMDGAGLQSISIGVKKISCIPSKESIDYISASAEDWKSWIITFAAICKALEYNQKKKHIESVPRIASLKNDEGWIIKPDLTIEEMLDVAQLTYAENEAFILNKRKDLYPKSIIANNIRYHKYGHIRPFTGCLELWALITSGLFAFLGLGIYLNTPRSILPLLITIPFFVLLAKIIIAFLQPTLLPKEKLQRDHKQLINEGQLILGQIEKSHGNINSFAYTITYFSPNDGDAHSFKWRDHQMPHLLKDGAYVILLFVDEKLRVVL